MAKGKFGKTKESQDIMKMIVDKPVLKQNNNHTRIMRKI